MCVCVMGGSLLCVSAHVFKGVLTSVNAFAENQYYPTP